jgi:hypothetical protein
VTTVAPIRCGDTIFLKGGATYSNSDGGAWRIACGSGEFYTCDCASTNRITLRVATNSEWSGSIGDFAFLAAGVTPNYNNVGLQRRGLVNVQNTDAITFGGNSTPQWFIMDGNPASTTDFAAHFLFSGNGGIVQFAEGQWLDSRNYSTADSGDAGLLVADTEDSIFHNINIQDNRKLGVLTGPFAGGPIRSVGLKNVVVRRTGPTSQGVNEPQDAFQIGCTRWDTSKGGGGASWLINSAGYDNYWNGIIMGGNNSCTDEVLRVRGFKGVGFGRTDTTDGSSSETAFESSGKPNSCDVADQQALWIFYSVFYGNRNNVTNGPHGQPGGIQNLFNSVSFLGGTGNADILYNRAGCEQEFWNNIIKTSTLPFGWNSNTGAIDRIPVAKNNLMDFWSAGTQSLTSFIFNGSTLSATTRSFNTAAANPSGQVGWLTASDLISSDSLRRDPQFVSTTGLCDDTGYSVGNMETRFNTCDFHLQGTSPAIDAGAFFLLTNGSGSGAATVMVQDNGHGANSPHATDPRMYFLEPHSFWHAGSCSNAPAIACSLDSECVGGTCVGDTIQIKGATCTNAGAELGSGERARVVNMNASTITVDRLCSWATNKGVHLAWSGNAPDVGAFEFGQGALPAPSLLSVDPLP